MIYDLISKQLCTYKTTEPWRLKKPPWALIKLQTWLIVKPIPLHLNTGNWLLTWAFCPSPMMIILHDCRKWFNHFKSNSPQIYFNYLANPTSLAWETINHLIRVILILWLSNWFGFHGKKCLIILQIQLFKLHSNYVMQSTAILKQWNKLKLE